MDYEEYEKQAKENEKRNNKLLNDFEKWMESSGLSAKTINSHIQNVSFYINDFLTYYDVTKAEEGFTRIHQFLSDWFIRKASWSSENSIKQNITSLKKFYSYLNEINLLDYSSYNFMLDEIKKRKNTWIDTVNRYYQNDMHFDIDFELDDTD